MGLKEIIFGYPFIDYQDPGNTGDAQGAFNALENNKKWLIKYQIKLHEKKTAMEEAREQSNKPIGEG